MRPRSTTQRGAAAETVAAHYLRAHGLTVIARNLRCKAGEIDIVCLDREVLVVVEVRQRGRADFGGASASVTGRKRRRIIRAAGFYWQRFSQWRARPMRFDVIALEGPLDGQHDITWIKHAFSTA